MTEYDIGAAFKAIEDELITSMIRNMDRHRAEETREGYNWSMWQAEQLKALEKYKRQNRKRYGKQFASINGQMTGLIRQARQIGNMQQEIRILQAIKKGFKVNGRNRSPAHQAMTAEFFRLNDRKLEALIKATTHDMDRAETAVLRMADDQYRKAIFNAQVYANSGVGTYEKAVDMATKDMLSRGLNCVEYANGARHTLSDYADMAIRTASKRAYLQGEGEKRQEWGIATVIMAKRGNPCPKCLPFVGKVLIDDVWSGGKKSDGPYPLMSTAIAAGLYHPRCKDGHTTYFPGISTADDTWTNEELEAIGQANQLEVERQYAKRQVERFSRLANHSLDEENRKKYSLKERLWKKAISTFDTLREHEPISVSQLKREYKTDLLDMLSQSDGRVQRIFLKHADKVAFINENAAGIGVTRLKGIRVNLKRDKNNPRGKYATTFHEIGHCIDRAGGDLSHKTPNFKNALKSDFGNVVNAYMKEYNVSQEEAYSLIGNALKDDKYHAVSDIAGGLTRNKCRGRYGHETRYWERNNALEKEAFAHFFEAYARNDAEKIDILSQMFPSASEKFLKLLEG